MAPALTLPLSRGSTWLALAMRNCSVLSALPPSVRGFLRTKCTDSPSYPAHWEMTSEAQQKEVNENKYVSGSCFRLFELATEKQSHSFPWEAQALTIPRRHQADHVFTPCHWKWGSLSGSLADVSIFGSLYEEFHSEESYLFQFKIFFKRKKPTKLAVSGNQWYGSRHIWESPSPVIPNCHWPQGIARMKTWCFAP